jgi:hypothetical protein
MNDTALISWIALLAFVIVSFLLSASSYTVYDNCPQSPKEEMELNQPALTLSTLIATTLGLVMTIACFLYTCREKGVFPSFVDILSGNGKGVVGSIMGVIQGPSNWYVAAGVATAFMLLLALILTVATELSGLEAMRECKVMTATSKEQIDKYIEAANMMNRLHGIVMLFVACAAIYLVYLIGQKADDRGLFDGLKGSGFGKKRMTLFGKKRKASL